MSRTDKDKHKKKKSKVVGYSANHNQFFYERTDAIFDQNQNQDRIQTISPEQQNPTYWDNKQCDRQRERCTPNLRGPRGATGLQGNTGLTGRPGLSGQNGLQ